MNIVLPPLKHTPVDCIECILRMGLPAELADHGRFTWVAERSAFHQVDGAFDKDEQCWVASVDEDISDARFREILQKTPVEKIAHVLALGYSACALDAWLRGASEALAYANCARAWQDMQRTVTWHFAELFQALALDQAGRNEDARATLAGLDELTVWHAVATLYGYRADVPHLSALWAVTQHCRVSLGRYFKSRLDDAEAGLLASGLPREKWRPTGYAP